MYNYTKISKALKDVRTKRELTQEELGKIINLHPKVIGRLERNELNVTGEHLTIYANGLNLEIEELIPKDNAVVKDNTATCLKVTNEELQLITLWRKLNNQSKALLKVLLESGNNL